MKKNKIGLKDIQMIETDMIRVVCGLCQKYSITYYLVFGTALGAVRHNGPIPWDSDSDIAVPFDQMNRLLDILNKEMPDKYYVSFYQLSPQNTSAHPEIMAKGVDGRIVHLDIYPIIGLSDELAEQKEQVKEIVDCARSISKIRFGPYGQKGDYRLKTLINRARHYMECMKCKLINHNEKSLKERIDSICNYKMFEKAQYVTVFAGDITDQDVMPRAFYGEGVSWMYEDLDLKIPTMFDEYLTRKYGQYRLPPPKNEINMKTFALIDESVMTLYNIQAKY